MMVIKEYECEKCGLLEDLQSHSEVHSKCWICGSKNIERLISKPLISKDGGPRTIGSQIDLNNKRNPLTRERAFGPDAEKKLKAQERMKKIQNLDTPEKMNKFIRDGTL